MIVQLTSSHVCLLEELLPGHKMCSCVSEDLILLWIPTTLDEMGNEGRKGGREERGDGGEKERKERGKEKQGKKERYQVVMWELDPKEDLAPKNWCFWIVVLEKTLESLGLQWNQTGQS